MKLNPSFHIYVDFIVLFYLVLVIIYFPWIRLIVRSEFWQDNEAFIDEGVPLEPFNLEKEREEGYFDENGNYVEYVNKNDIKVVIFFIV